MPEIISFYAEQISLYAGANILCPRGTSDGVVALEFAVEGREVYAEDVGGAGLVVVDGGEGVEYVAALDLFECGAQAVGVAYGGGVARRVAYAWREAVEVEYRAAQCEGALDGVL